jgi:hypothetical protein
MTIPGGIETCWISLQILSYIISKMIRVHFVGMSVMWSISDNARYEACKITVHITHTRCEDVGCSALAQDKAPVNTIMYGRVLFRDNLSVSHLLEVCAPCSQIPLRQYDSSHGELHNILSANRQVTKGLATSRIHSLYLASLIIRDTILAILGVKNCSF